MTVAFMGLTGPLGVLPHAYTEMLMARRRAGDPTASAFLDLFNHRMISLFFRAWEKYRPALARERGEEDPLARCLYSLIGLGIAPLRDRHEFPDAALLFHAGAFAQRRRPAVGARIASCATISGWRSRSSSSSAAGSRSTRPTARRSDPRGQTTPSGRA